LRLVPRTIYASFKIVDIVEGSAQCWAGLLGREEVRYRLTTYEVGEWRAIAQVPQGFSELGIGTVVRFGDTPLKEKVCPGAEELVLSGDRIVMRREPCWEVPPKGMPFCPKHFNTNYGRYIRFVFGSGKPDPGNPFFKLPALVYMIYYGSSRLKVGTTIVLKGMRRFLEQPSPIASPLVIAPSIVEARKAEVGISRHRSVTQAPRQAERLSNLVSMLRDRVRWAPRAACALHSIKTHISVVLKQALSDHATEYGEPYKLISLMPVGEEIGGKILMVHSIKEANRLLGGRQCTISAAYTGLLILRCSSEAVGLPFELVRDRLIEVEELVPVGQG